MSSALERQISAIQKANDAVTHRQLSSLFSDHESSYVDCKATFEASLGALEQLLQYDGRFETYKQILFQASAPEFQRKLCTKKELINLDVTIDKFLILLSLWITEPASHIILECLIGIYEINVHNVDSLLKSVLTIHDSKVFAKIVKMCKIEDSPWQFLAGVKASRSSCPRSLIAKYCKSSNWLLQSIADLMIGILDLIGIDGSAINVDERELLSVTNMISFYTAIILEIADAKVADKTFLNIVVKIARRSFQSINCGFRLQKVLLDWQASSCLILSRICSKVKISFEDPPLVVLCTDMVTSFFWWKDGNCDLANKVCGQIIMTLIVFGQQDQLRLERNFLWVLSTDPAKIESFSQTLMEFYLKRGSIVATYVANLLFDSIEESASTNTDEIVCGISNFLCKLIVSRLVDKSFIDKMINILMTRCDHVLHSRSFLLRRIFMCISEVDQDAMNKVTTTEDWYSSLISDSSPESIFLQLIHPLKSKRISAIREISSPNWLCSKGECCEIVEQLLLLMEEVDFDIASTIWEIELIQKVASFSTSNKFADSFQRSLLLWMKSLEKNTCKQANIIVTKILRLLVDSSIFHIINENVSTECRLRLYSWIVCCCTGNFDIPTSIGQLILSKFSSLILLPFVITQESNGNVKIAVDTSRDVNHLSCQQLELYCSILIDQNSALVVNSNIIFGLKSLENCVDGSVGWYKPVLNIVLEMIKHASVLGLFQSSIELLRGYLVSIKGTLVHEFEKNMDFHSFVLSISKDIEDDLQYKIFSVLLSSNNESLFSLFESFLEDIYGREYFGGVFCRMIFSCLSKKNNSALLSFGFEGLLAVLNQLKTKLSKFCLIEKFVCMICFPLIYIGCTSTDLNIRSYSVSLACNIRTIDTEKFFVEIEKSSKYASTFSSFLQHVISCKSSILSGSSAVIQDSFSEKRFGCFFEFLLDICFALKWQRPLFCIQMWDMLKTYGNAVGDFRLVEIFELIDICPKYVDPTIQFQLDSIFDFMKGWLVVQTAEQCEAVGKLLSASLSRALVDNHVNVVKGLVSLVETGKFFNPGSTTVDKILESIFNFWFYNSVELSLKEIFFCSPDSPYKIALLLQSFVNQVQLSDQLPVSKVLAFCATVLSTDADSSLLSILLTTLLGMLERKFQSNLTLELIMETSGLISVRLTSILRGNCFLGDRFLNAFKQRCSMDVEKLFDTMKNLNTLHSQRYCIDVLKFYRKIVPGCIDQIFENAKIIYCNGLVNVFAEKEIIELLMEYDNNNLTEEEKLVKLQIFFQALFVHLCKSLPLKKLEQVLCNFWSSCNNVCILSLIIKSLVCVSLALSEVLKRSVLNIASKLILGVPVHLQLCIIRDILVSINFFTRISFTDNSDDLNLSTKTAIDFLCNNMQKGVCDNDDNRTISSEISMEHLNFSIQLMEANRFHSLIADGETTSGLNPQQQLVELADAITNMVSFLEHCRKRLQSATKDIRSNDHRGVVAPKASIDVMLESSNILLLKLQAVLNPASFYNVLQNLMGHKLLSIRQRSISILQNRLKSIHQNSSRITVDGPFLSELITKLKYIVQDFVCVVEQKIPTNLDGKCALAQSAVMCLDAIAHCVGNHLFFKTIMLVQFEDSTTWIHLLRVYLYGNEQKHPRREAIEIKKLLAALIIFASSLSRYLKLSVVPHLHNITETMQVTFQNELQCWRNASNLQGFQIRTNVLLFRSLVSSYSVLIDCLSAVIHQNLHGIIPCLFELYAVCCKNCKDSEVQEIRGDIDRCCSIICRKLSSRVLLPMIMLNFQTVGNDRVSIRRLVSFIGTVVQFAERSDLLIQLNEWLQICLSLIGYREPNGDGFIANQEIEKACAKCVVDISLKLTENELKSLLLRVDEWRNTPDDCECGLRLSSVYCIVDSLLFSLKNLSAPYMSHIWKNLIMDFSNIISDPTETNFIKKRKRTGPRQNASSVHTTLKLIERMTSVARECCDFSSDEFLNEDRFNELYPSLLSVFILRDLFEDDQLYLFFFREHVIPTIIKLCQRINNDLCWKPLNHQLLLLTRNENPCIKIAAVCALQCLFEEVGVDYLQLLPECLPFISELMEDEDRNVISTVNRAIVSIEELSGESFQSLLQ